MTTRVNRLLPFVGVLLLLICSSAVVTGAVTTDSETRYNGSEADADQAIEVTYTVAPDGGTINNMTVDFDRSGQTFIQPNSFSITVSPGGADANVESRSGNRFFIQELEPNEEVTFVFEVYPKSIKQEQLSAATVRLEYIQNGQSLSDSDTITANTTSSPWFELQSAEQTIDEQSSQLDQISLAGQITDVLFVAGVVLGLVGVGFGIYSWRRRTGDRTELRRQHAANLESLAERMESTSDGKLLKNEAEEIRENSGGGSGGWKGEGDDGDW